jgi:NADH-quinone oxidoreductase subunit J
MIADFLFFLFAAASILGSVLVITRKNPVASVLWLVVVFFSLSGMFLLLEAHFIAALQVILYAGAIMVLFLFVVMLLNLGHGAEEDIRGPLGRFLAGTLGLALAGTVTKFFLGDGAPPLGEGENVMRAAMAEKGVVGAVAEPLFREYVVPFEVTGLLLLMLLMMVGMRGLIPL